MWPTSLGVLILFLLENALNGQDLFSFGIRPAHFKITLEISQEGLDFTAQAIGKELEIKLPKKQFPEKRVKFMKTDINLNSMKFDHFVSPVVSLQLFPASRTLKITVREGDFKVCASYVLKKLIFRSSGKICVWAHPPKDILVEIDVETIVNGFGRLETKVTNCQANVGFDMKVSGSVLAVFNKLIKNKVSELFGDQIGVFICDFINENLKAVFDRTRMNLTERLGLMYSIHRLDIGLQGINIEFSANVFNRV